MIQEEIEHQRLVIIMKYHEVDHDKHKNNASAKANSKKYSNKSIKSQNSEN